MSLKAKYQPVIDLLKKMKLNHLKVKEDNGALIIRGEVNSVRAKEILLKKIHQINSDNAMDINFEVEVKNY